MSDNFDLIVIGAGPGGYVAARRGAQLGLNTALIEKENRLGGTCLLRGCIPTKALIHAAEVWRLCRKGSKAFGISVDGAAFDWARVQKRKEMATIKGAKGVDLLMQQAGVTVIQGTGRLDGPGRVSIETSADRRELTAPKIILATGSYAAGLPGIIPDGKRVLTSDHLLEIDHVPASMVVLGAGAVGVELAGVMQSFGCRVTLVELMDRVLPVEDPDCSEEVARALKRQGMTVRAGCKARDVQEAADGIRCVLEQVDDGVSEEVDSECLLVAVGRRPATNDLGLDTVEVVRDKRGFIQTDGFMETSTPGLYAIGDIVPTAQLAHVASHEALVAAGHAAGRVVHPIRYGRVPSCTYSNPEVASVGLTEAAAIEAGYQARTGRFPFSALGKASILNEPHGFVKVVSEAETGEVLGVHMVGPRVTELISGAATAMGFDADVERWSEVIHPHPSLSEALGEAVQAAAGNPLHGS
ncbi:MAG: dihydrolipoyl dehydrogenase [Candidatus Krumholzibacteria bacterium]|nr:dihydrolipoyl dehydrogenase [Candidatus Krumholzibacteria bacterium]